MARQRAASQVWSGLTGCDKIRATVNALTKHMLPVQAEGRPSNAVELTQSRLDSGNKIPANTSGVSTPYSFRKSFVKDDVQHEYTPEVHQTSVKKGTVTGSQQVSGPAYMKFDLKKKGHYTGYKPL